MEMKHTDEPRGCGCGSIVLERNRYFNGKYMTARDFAGEQRYFLSRHRLHNRLFHGWGVVCGLRVIPHPNEDCDRWVVVRAGIALDCCGREIVLCSDTPFELPLPVPAPDVPDPDVPDQDDPDAPAAYGAGEEPGQGEPLPEDGPPGPFLICLSYGEEEIETVPVLHAEGPCDPHDREANRLRETARLGIVALDEVDPGCWRVPEGDPEAACRDDCDDQLPGPAGGCLEPECPCGGCVPLALVYPVDPESGWQAGWEIDTAGRRQLPVPADYLTHIAAINWPHGGELTLSQLRDDLSGELRVAFDRRLLPAEGEANGINPHTFLVHYGGEQLTLELLPAADDEGGPTLEGGGCVAVFKIDPGFLRGKRNLAGNVVYVTLRCDFILDCHEIPVDGEHLGGRLPSGDRTPGGTFLSWFRVVPDAASEKKARYKK